MEQYLFSNSVLVRIINGILTRKEQTLTRMRRNTVVVLARKLIKRI